MSVPFLLEIGCEEIPDWMIVPAINQLHNLFKVLLNTSGLGGKVDWADATPRRLVLRASGLAARQADSEELVLGPPKSAGAGAATGFARKMGAKLEDLGTETTAKGEYFSLLRKTVGRPASAILAEALPEIILKLYFPKTMYWTGKTGPRFIRPIRWIVALLSEEIVPFELAGVRSGAESRGHRQLGLASFPVTIDNFEESLAANRVVLRAAERRARIASGIQVLLEGQDLRIKADADLLDTLVYITEHPTPILGSFDPAYLALPREVLSTVMRHHQKYFSVEDSDGNLAPYFIAVTNTDGDDDGLIRHGNERVLRARFNDARFFWEVDQKKTLEQRVPDLANVTFQAKVGSYLEKAKRIEGMLEAPEGKRAALFCKCDLTTDLVKEFTDLQGQVGGLYAQAQGEPEPVWRAIYEHYKPLSMDDAIPATALGQELAFADKLDTLRECFKAGLAPTGSKDPFALRRAAQGLIRILAEGTAVDHTLNEAVDLQAFLEDRVKYYFRDIRGNKYDEVNACMAAGWSDLRDLEARLKRVQAVRTTPDFEPLAASFKRIKNILRQANFTGSGALIAEDLLETGPELELFEESLKPAALEDRIASLRPKIDTFFDKILVNAPDAKVRENRLTLLNSLLHEFSAIADFSEIVTESK